jgi:Tfp pilus assembly protein PilN
MDINFVRRPVAIGTVGLVLTIVGLCATAWVADAYVDGSRQLDAWDAKLREIKDMSRRTPGAMAESPRDSRELQQEARVANSVLRQIAVPWDTLFREIETNTDESIALLSVQPDLQSRTVRIAGEAKNLPALLGYIRRLDATRALSNVYLTGHEVKTRDAQRPVSFSLVAAWAEKR